MKNIKEYVHEIFLKTIFLPLRRVVFSSSFDDILSKSDTTNATKYVDIGTVVANLSHTQPGLSSLSMF